MDDFMRAEIARAVAEDVLPSGTLLRAVRQSYFRTQAEFASSYGGAPSSVACYENGFRRPAGAAARAYRVLLTRFAAASSPARSAPAR